MRLYFTLLLMFLVSQFMGIYAGSYIIEDALTNEYIGNLMTVEAGAPSLLYFVLAVIFGAVLFIILHRLHISLLFTLLELAVISATSSIFFYAIIKPFMVATLESMVVAILLAMIFSVLKQLYHHRLKNTAALVSSAGAGAVFGFTFGFTTALIFLFILAVYDYISVFKTKHMITMANEIVERDMAFTISAEKTLPSGKKSRLDLGTGDLSLPIMVEVAAYTISPLLSLFALAGATIGTLFVLFIAWKHHKILPALPPITAGIFIFTIAALLLGIV